MHYRYLLAAVALAGCQRTADTLAPERELVRAAVHNHGSPNRNTNKLPADELARVRLATAKYADFQKAVADGYADINVVLPNMGRHFLKDSLLDARFEAERPELLVYAADTRGHMNLVAVEYAVPLSLSEQAPEGFTGAADEWFADQGFKLWTLHAWVWAENPDGMFTPTNTRVP